MSETGLGDGARVRRVVVLGTGLIGTSVALAAGEHGAAVWLADRDPTAQQLAADLGAGNVLPEAGPPGGPVDIAVLAMPPAAVAFALRDAQSRGLAAVYTDVASVKVLPITEARRLGCDLSTFVAGHPLGGRERSGPAAARADLFLGRPWALCPEPETSAETLAAAQALARVCDAEPVVISADEHDRAVALVSHAPHVASCAMAASLEDATDTGLTLAGQGVRDVTRIAASDVRLWTQILAANAGPVAEVLAGLAGDLASAAEALREVAGGDENAAKRVADLLVRANTGVARIPGKRGGPAPEYIVVQVVIGDRPGELARLFQAAGDAEVNVEDVAVEHSPGLPVGVAELSVRPEAAPRLATALRGHGWPVRL